VPAELRQAITLAKQYITGGTLQEVESEAAKALGDLPFSRVSAEGPWDDVLHYRFRCRQCGELFELAAETYHGSGGAWKPENKASIRERL
jgi:hypothetical protein